VTDIGKCLGAFMSFGSINSYKSARMTQVSGNIVLAGETGAGKSSIINMIAGTTFAQTSSGAAGCTLQSDSYILPMHDRNYRFFDTVGLDEGEKGTVERTAVIANLYKFISGLEDGINLLIFCMRGPRIKNTTHQNWKLFHDIICNKKIPTLLVVTGLENEENMNKWWWNNRRIFEDQGIYPDDTACITAIRGRTLKDGRHAFDDQYEESQSKILNMVLNRVLLRPQRVAKIDWFYKVLSSLCAFFGWPMVRDAKVIRDIATLCSFSPEETRRLGEEFDSDKP